MAARIQVGGDPEQYMDAPSLSMGGEGKKGGGGIIATVLDALGIGRQVAKAPKDTAAPATTQSVPQAPATLPVINDLESVVDMSKPMPADWGKKYLDSLKPIKTIDPNTAL